MEAIRFSPDTDVLIGGFGLYGGRGTYSAEVKVNETAVVAFVFLFFLTFWEAGEGEGGDGEFIN